MQESDFTDILYEPPTKPKNYILSAIVVALITHIGIVALIYAIRSVYQMRKGNLEEASEHAKTARQWLIGCIILPCCVSFVSNCYALLVSKNDALLLS